MHATTQSAGWRDVADLVHDASFLGFGIIAVVEVIGVSAEVNEDNIT